MRRTFKNGTSLFEVLIALGIISVTMVVTMSIFLSSTKKLKEEEIKDSVNSINIKALELLKSQKEVLVTVVPTSPNGTFYALKQGQELFLSQVSNETLDKCVDETNPYFYDITDVIKNFNEQKRYLVCTQIKIVPSNISINNQNYYEVSVKTVYGFVGEQKVDNFMTYRYFGFKLYEPG